ncbi:ABC transporter-related protein [Natrinema pellirubrum DSM 15624]|uniref:ABC transporter-related protein n=1 Tax=Natrinema pellirubrum (strain DSM 15624 / CIP 106293 / JCM 10476 / NCIMB 786 / 157) TaxID=797303 RepID=L0JSX8_NATP1|nr:ABC transporter ATP-binding protein [Natrinema pellirubrum]AGB33752.1 ABC-type antimicrobial peptide transport system, ATPase component [Natrinema pellirubrum DSM 15624]ELY71990.1 ABC transporter-related protein [Natrinema pellirubrum DSM 15624]
MARSAASHQENTDISSIVTADGVTKVYTRGSEPGRLGRVLGRSDPPTVTAVDSVSIEVSNGEIVGLAGPSGSGKSTLLHILAGLEQPTAGSVLFQGSDLARLSKRERSRHRLEQIGIVFQQFHLLDSLSARANVALPLVELGVPKRQRRKKAADLLERVGLGDRITHRPGELSGGERQRVAIARALVTDPALLVADEPTGELDTDTGRTVLQAFKQVAENRAVVLASHDRETLEICDRVVTLRDGRTVDRMNQGTSSQ